MIPKNTLTALFQLNQRSIKKFEVVRNFNVVNLQAAKHEFVEVVLAERRQFENDGIKMST